MSAYDNMQENHFRILKSQNYHMKYFFDDQEKCFYLLFFSNYNHVYYEQAWTIIAVTFMLILHCIIWDKIPWYLILLIGTNHNTEIHN